MRSNSGNSSDNLSSHEGAIPAREHSYLPGSSHPLFPEQLLGESFRSIARKRARGGFRYRDASNEECVCLEDDEAGDGDDSGNDENSLDTHKRATGKPACRLMELTVLELDGVVFFPGSTLPIRLRNPKWIEYLGTKIDAARGIATGAIVSKEEVRMGIITRVEKIPQRRQPERNSWMRAGFRLDQRGAGQMAAMLNEYVDQFQEDGHVLRQSHLDDDGDDVGDDSSEDGISNGSTNSSATGQDATAPQGQNVLDPLIGRTGTMGTITYTHEDAGGDIIDDTRSMDADSLTDNRPHQFSRVWQRNKSGQIVFTVLGTGRFRILSRLGDTSNDERPFYPSHYRNWGDEANIKVYLVELLSDEELPLPPVMLRQKSSSDSVTVVANANDDPLLLRHERLVQNLSVISPIPTFAFRNVWPWRLVRLIRMALDRISGDEGLRRGGVRVAPLDSSSTSRTHGHLDTSNSTPETALMDPMRFSFWMSGSMPLSEKERIRLLEMDCTIERLRFIYNKVLEQERSEHFICCNTCGRRLSQVSNLFTVEGAEGTTGAYVNEHGVIHQTTTLRQVKESSVTPEGGAEYRDSWFPGYTWTITHCRFCRSHLGWKFDSVEPLDSHASQTSENRPRTFWGLSCASITATTQLNPISNQEESDDEEG